MEMAIYSKRNLETMIDNLEYCLDHNEKPNFLGVVGKNLIEGIFYGGIGYYLGVFSSAALKAIDVYLKKYQDYSIESYIEFYSSWLNSMNSAEFIAVKARLYNIKDVQEGVKFIEGMPKLEGFQQANGNWILPE